MSMPHISGSELEVMKVLWEFGEATSPQIVTALEHYCQWKPKTIQTLLARLVQKGAVTADKCGRAFLYRPAVDEAGYRGYAFRDFLGRVYGGSVGQMFSSLVSDRVLSPEEIGRIKKILDKE